MQAWDIIVSGRYGTKGDVMAFAIAFRKFRTYMNTVGALRNCTDKQLDDIGIRREDIRKAARRSVANSFG
jgi:uncharacterized protein YjiS (DUF1127 family)